MTTVQVVTTVQVDRHLLARLNDFCACASLIAPLVPTALEDGFTEKLASHLNGLIEPEGLVCRIVRSWNGWGIEYYRQADGLTVRLEARP